LRRQLKISKESPVDLWSVPEPDDSRRPTIPLPLLLKVAIYGGENNKLTLRGIYQVLIDRFKWYKENEKSRKWKQCVRQTLTDYEVFVLLKRTERGQRNYWTVDLSRGGKNNQSRKRGKNRNGKPIRRSVERR
ncbi:hypothetical protein DFH09DRAFT_957826, partial [Mycena vulgaris]